jgi:hypothetical protein
MNQPPPTLSSRLFSMSKGVASAAFNQFQDVASSQFVKLIDENAPKAKQTIVNAINRLPPDHRSRVISNLGDIYNTLSPRQVPAKTFGNPFARRGGGKRTKRRVPKK